MLHTTHSNAFNWWVQINNYFNNMNKILFLLFFISQNSMFYIRLFMIQMWLNKLYTKGYELIRHFSHIFNLFLSSKFVSSKIAYAIFKVVYQASHIPKIRKIYGLVAETCSKKHIFHTFLAIFGPKNFFLAKLPMPYSK